MDAKHAHVTFSVENVRYAIPASCVVEIVRAAAVTPLRAAPAVVQGIIDYRGAVLPVFDVARRFRHQPREVRAAHRMIVAETGRRRVVLHVDSVESLADIDPGAIDQVATRLPSDVPIAGIARTPDGLLVIQDLDRFLDDAESRQLEEALSSR